LGKSTERQRMGHTLKTFPARSLRPRLLFELTAAVVIPTISPCQTVETNPRHAIKTEWTMITRKTIAIPRQVRLI
jgi:hypothetical protein